MAGLPDNGWGDDQPFSSSPFALRAVQSAVWIVFIIAFYRKTTAPSPCVQSGAADMIDFRNLGMFLWVARLASFRRAAERLNTTQPAISAWI